MLNYERLLYITTKLIICALLDLVVAECDTVEAAEVKDTRIECAECVTLNYDILVITAVLLLGDTAVVSNVSITPSLATIQAVIEYVVADLYVTNT